jgi:hypothetical protein
MALKGKKKSRVRGSQARRKPAAAPRPSYGTHQKARWYQTTQGLVIGFLIAVTLIVFVWWWVADSRSDAQALENEQRGLQIYTTDLRTLFQNLTPITSEIQAASTLKDDELPEKAKAWKNQLAEVQSTVAAVTPPADLTALNGLVAQAMVLYGQAIDTYELLPEVEGNAREQLAAKAASSFGAANNLLGIVIQMLDAERTETDLQPSGVTAPGAQELPTTTPGSQLTPSAPPEGGG